MAAEKLQAALDIGTTKIVAVVGEQGRDGGVIVLGHGSAPAEGLKRGTVIDMDRAARSIRRAIEDAQLLSGTEIDRVTVGIAGEHVRSINSSGVIGVNRSDNEITGEDVARVIAAARAVAIPTDREIIHVVPQEYTVDDQTDIKDPIGMTGVRLEVEAHLVTASVTSARNLYRTLERCKLDIDHLVLESLALSHTLLSDHELQTSVLLVDIGGENTSLALFRDGAIRYTAVIALGGRAVSSDLAIGLRLPLDQAEEIKLLHGAALAALVDPEENIALDSATDKSGRTVSRHVLASIIEPRMEEIFSLVVRELKKIQRSDIPATSMVLTGGGARLGGVAELAEQMFDIPVRIGQVTGFAELPDEINNPNYATALGLLLYAFNHEPVSGQNGPVRGLWKRLEHWISKQF